MVDLQFQLVLFFVFLELDFRVSHGLELGFMIKGKE